MSSKVEEVARAMHDAVNVTGEPWVYVKGDAYCEAQMTCARAAIEAMREPNDAMLMAGGEAILNADEEWKSNACYRAMIDAALREEGR